MSYFKRNYDWVPKGPMTWRVSARAEILLCSPIPHSRRACPNSSLTCRPGWYSTCDRVLREVNFDKEGWTGVHGSPWWGRGIFQSFIRTREGAMKLSVFLKVEGVIQEMMCLAVMGDHTIIVSKRLPSMPLVTFWPLNDLQRRPPRCNILRPPC